MSDRSVDAPVLTPALIAELERGFGRWVEDRLVGVCGVHGPLALVDFHGVGCEWSRVEGLGLSVCVGEGGVVVRPDEGVGVVIDGVPVVGEGVLGFLGGGGGPLLEVGGVVLDAFGFDGESVELREYRVGNERALGFGGIEVWPFDPGLVVVGEFVSSGVVESVGWDFSRVEDSRHAKRVPGVLVVVLGGVRYELLTFVDHGALVVVFADATTGVESHAPGRFLRLEGVVGSGPVVVDFNRAFIPPCGFSDFFNCPLPPAQNRLGVAVRGGERHVVWLGEGGLGSVVGGV